MRVVDNSVKPASNEMPNKGRRRQRRESEVYEDSSDEGVEAAGQSGVQCPHINKGVNQAQVKKALQKSSPHLECAGCSKEGASGARGRTEPTPDTGLDEELEATLWLCLQCGHQGCGRNSRSQHALKHYETPRSGCHSVVVNTTTWMVWCYECDNDVAFDRGKKLALCVDFVRRHYGVPRLPNDSTGKKSPQQSSPREETVDAGGAMAGKGADKQNLNTAKSPLARVKGLNNLGNTCFFNAVMQNLSQTHVLEAALMWSTKGGSMTLYPPTANDVQLQLEPLEVMLSVPPSALQSALLSFLREMTAPTGKASLNPKHLFGQVCQKSPRFKGFQQQDSHELLRYLLDGLRLEELKRVKSGILRKFGLSESTNPKTVDDDVKGRVKEYGRLVRETFVDFVFGGQMVNTVQCEECKNISQVHEPFLDISLPIVEERSPPSRGSNPFGNKQKGKGAKGRTNLDTETGEAAHAAMNELAMRDDQSPSKHQLKKAKKQARREARNAQKKGKTPPASEVTSPTAEATVDDGQEETEAKTDEAQQEKIAAEESDTSQEKGENPSSSMEDADECSDSEAVTKPSSKPTTPKHSPSQESSPAVNLPPTEESGDTGEGKDVKEVTMKLEAMSIEAEHNYAVKPEKSKPQGQDRPTSLEGSSKEKTSSKTQSEQTSSEASCKAKSVTDDVNSTESELCSRIDHLRMSGTESDATSPTQSPDRTQDDGDKGSGNDTQDLKTQDVPEDDNTKIIPQGEDVQDNKEVEEAEEKTTTTIVSQEGKNGSFPSITLTQGSPKKVSKTIKDERNECLKSKVQYSFEEISEEGAVGGRGRSSSVGEEIAGNTKPPSTLAPRYLGSSQECSIQFCLHQFTAPELLTGSNKFGCEFCTRRKRKESGKTEREKDKDDTVYCNASKQMLVSWPPDVLTLHLKRFQQAGFSLRKVNRHVNFPLMLDLAPFCTSTCKPIADNYNRILYTLYGIVEHSGSLRAGHYTAYVKVRQASDKLRTQVLNKPNSWNYGKGTPRNKVGTGGHQGNLVNGDVSLEESDDEVDWKGGDSAPLPPVPEGKWYHISDTHVSEVSESKVLNAQAFLLFYERILS